MVGDSRQADADTKTKTRPIEITPAMAEAGLAAFYQSDRRFDLDSEIVARIYLSMAAIAPT